MKKTTKNKEKVHKIHQRMTNFISNNRCQQTMNIFKSLKKYTFVLLFLATLFPGYLVPLLSWESEGRLQHRYLEGKREQIAINWKEQQSRKRQLAGSGKIV